MAQDLKALEEESRRLIAEAKDPSALESLRVRFLGRKGSLTQFLRTLSELSEQDRKKSGAQANTLKKEIEQLIDAKEKELKAHPKSDSADLDLSLPGRKFPLGRRHPLTQVTQEILDIFTELGFQRADGPEIELDELNFAALNFPLEHPSRDAQDTFYLKGRPTHLLRTHTSPIQIRVLRNQKPPFRVVAPGRVYRHEAVDATHSAVFHQVEGFAADADVSFSDLKGMLTAFAKRMFGPNQATRFKPSYFPFTEPSAQVDVKCFGCQGKGCKICKQSGWIEMLGAGLIHPNVFRATGHDPNTISGYAFGMGVERIAMLKHSVTDIRMFYENDLSFLEQF